MITRIGFAPRRAEMDIAAAQHHWRSEHARLSLGLPRLRRYWQMHAVLREGWPLLPWPGFDCCSELDFDSIADMDQAFVSDHYLGPLRADEAKLLDKSKGGSLIARRQLLSGERDSSDVRLMIFMRVAALHAPVELAEAVLALSHPADVRAREVYVALQGDEAMQRTSLFDVVESLWFDGPDQALAFACSGIQAQRRSIIAGLVRGTEHLVARVNVVL